MSQELPTYRWGYRLVEHQSWPGDEPRTWVAIHTVTWADGVLVSVSPHPVSLVGDTPDDIWEDVLRTIDARYRPVISFAEFCALSKKESPCL